MVSSLQDGLGSHSGRPSDVLSGFPLSGEALAKLRLRAIRRGVWYSELKASERKLLNLTIAIVRRIRSLVLAKMVSGIVEKLLGALEGKLERLMRTTGRELAQNLSRIALSWGNRSAVEWAGDPGFIRYLVVCQINSGWPQ